MRATRLPIIAFLLSPLATGTSFIVVWGPAVVAVAVDGRGTYHANGTDRAIPACKALRIGDTVYTAAGDIPPGLKDTITTAGISAGGHKVATSVQGLVFQNRLHDPTYYSKYRPGYVILTILSVRVGLKAGGKQLTQFLIGEHDGIVARTIELSGATGIFCACLGQPPAPPIGWEKGSPTKFVRDALTAGFQSDPFSGPPLTIIRVTPNKAEWLELGNCKADGSNAWDTTPPQ